MEAGPRSPFGNAQGGRDLRERIPQVVVQDHDRPLLRSEPSKGLVKLVPSDDTTGHIGTAGRIGWDDPDARRPAALTASLGIAGVDDQAVEPGVEAFGIAQARQVPPGAEECLLGRVLRPVRVAQDPERKGVAAVDVRGSQGGECLLVAPTRPLDELGLHLGSGSRAAVWPPHRVWSRLVAKRSVRVVAQRSPEYIPRMSDDGKDASFKAVLTGEHTGLRRARPYFKRIPTSPRCKLCLAPFGGPGGAIMRHFGFARFPANPALCQNCIGWFRKVGVSGAVIPVTLLFADVRGSTGIGERLAPADFHAFLSGFYRLASKAILDHDGLVDKLVGDEIIGLFFGGITGRDHAAAAIAAGLELLERVGRPGASPMGAIPVGAGVHTGDAFVGTTGPEDAVDDFTALGDPVNTTARLASSAAAGELLVSVVAADMAGRPTEGLERRTLDVRGRHEPIEVIVLRPVAGR